MSQPQNEMRSIMTSTVGGVMTEEVGAVTGSLEVATRLQAGGLEVAVRYAGADEWYRVEGSPVPLDGGARLLALIELHRRVLEYLTKPGAVVGGNEESTTLRKLSFA